ncbi:MAG: hypothetical protein AB7Q17_15220 [Phycisphaerae bacterium]
MLDQLIESLPSLGVAGLLFVMWWIERQERVRMQNGLADSLEAARQISGLNEQLLDVVRANTEALGALREELHTHRVAENEWIGRLTHGLDAMRPR